MILVSVYVFQVLPLLLEFISSGFRNFVTGQTVHINISYCCYWFSKLNPASFTELSHTFCVLLKIKVLPLTYWNSHSGFQLLSWGWSPEAGTSSYRIFESPILKGWPQQLAPSRCSLTVYWVEINGISQYLMILVNLHSRAMGFLNLENRFISLGLVKKNPA